MKISLKAFINKTKGTKVDVPGHTTPTRIKGQCVTLVQAYVMECLGLPFKARGNAVDWDETFVREGLGTITKTPRYGDIVVFNPPYAGKYGHIAIYINSNTMYDQNNGTHDNRCAGYAKLMKGGVYIRPNEPLIPDETDEYTKGVYQLLTDMYLRKGAGTNFDHVKVGETTQAMRSALTSTDPNARAVVKKGTNVTALEVIENENGTWLKNYSGYICIKNADGEYCKRI